MFITSQGIIIIANSVRDQIHNAARDAYGTRSLAIGCAFTNLGMLIARVSHKGVAYRFESVPRALHLLVHLSFFGCHLAMLESTLRPPVNIVVHAAIAVCPILFDILVNESKGEGISHYDALLHYHEQRRTGTDAKEIHRALVELERESARDDVQKRASLDQLDGVDLAESSRRGGFSSPDTGADAEEGAIPVEEAKRSKSGEDGVALFED